MKTSWMDTRSLKLNKDSGPDFHVMGLGLNDSKNSSFFLLIHEITSTIQQNKSNMVNILHCRIASQVNSCLYL